MLLDEKSEMLRDLVMGALESHPLPWHIDDHICHRVIAADGTLIANCTIFPNRARKIIELANELSPELQRRKDESEQIWREIQACDQAFREFAGESAG